MPYVVTTTLARRDRSSMLTLLLGLALMVAAAVHSPVAAVAATEPGWYHGDLHTHTYLSDGRRTQAQVGVRALGIYGGQFFANTDHGGTTRTDTGGVPLRRAIPHSTALSLWSTPTLDPLRATYPDRMILQGFEWNVPAHDHANVIFTGSDPAPVIAFETQFDRSNTASPTVGTKRNRTHSDALRAVRWLQANHAHDGFLIVNHPSRKLQFSARDLRELHDAGPDVVVGFEGMPGGQRASTRGGYWYSFGGSTTLARTWGGADYMVAKVGGVWDSLLAEGRHLYIFANSDFHTSTWGFWPGEYSRTYVWLDRPSDPTSLPDALRSGRSFTAHGNLIDRLDVTATGTGAAEPASMGETLTVDPGATVTLTIDVRVPARVARDAGLSKLTTGTAAPLKLDHVDVIMSKLVPKAAPGTSSYAKATNSSAKVVARVPARSLTYTRSGWARMTVRVPRVTADSYIRLRGTNHRVARAKETDAAGNPLCDTLVGTNNAEKAKADLWFYSNPLWIDVR